MPKQRFQAATDAPDPLQNRLVPFGSNGGGQWTAHPIGLVIVLGILLIGLIGVPEFRIFFLLSLLIGVSFGFFLLQLHRRQLLQREIVPFGLFGGSSRSGGLAGMVLFALGALLTELIGVPIPIIKLFFFVAVPAGSLVGFILWLRHKEESPQLFSKKS